MTRDQSNDVLHLKLFTKTTATRQSKEPVCQRQRDENTRKLEMDTLIFLLVFSW